MENKKNKLFEEQLRKMKYRYEYKLSESPKYRPLVGSDEEFDNLPEGLYNTDDGQPVPVSPNYTNEAGEQEDAPKPEGTEPPEPTNSDVPAGLEPTPEDDKFPTQVPASGNTPENTTGIGDVMGNSPNAPANDTIGAIGMNPAKPVDDIQNDIIKHNIAAMKSIHDQLEGLNATVQGLNSKLETLNADVEEVREPTNSEKLMNKTSVSYPYYFNLNDFWQGNFFNENRKNENEKGMRQLPDGTYIADFDDLPQQSKTDIQNSFNDF